VVLLAAVSGWLLGRRPVSGRRPRLVPVVTLRVVGAGLVVAGVLVLRAAGTVQRTACGGSDEPLGCADCVEEPPETAGVPSVNRCGLGTVLGGGVLLRAYGRRLRGDWRLDQQ
jgi:hypothetical protein